MYLYVREGKFDVFYQQDDDVRTKEKVGRC